MPDIDFARIRAHRGDRGYGFEELLRQILIAFPPPDCVRIEHKGIGADGGVEVLVHRNDGSSWGYQSKYFSGTFGASQIAQIRSSFQAALTNYPALTRYVVAIPRNLSGDPRARSQRRLWESYVQAAGEEATALGREVTIELWDESELVARLTGTDPVRAGLRQYWFDALTLTPEWFRARFMIAAADLGERYHPDDHVPVSTGRVLELLARADGYHRAVADHIGAYGGVADSLDRLARFAIPAGLDLAVLNRVQADVSTASALAGELFSAPVGGIDATPLTRQLEALLEGEDVESLRDRQFSAPEGTTLAEATDRLTETDIRRALDSLFTGFHDLQASLRRLDAELLKSQRLLLVGEAGAGKSHSLADLAHQHLERSAPVVLLLGQHIPDGDPRVAIMNRLGLPAMPFETFLGALQAAALAANRPGLILIDGLNESRNARLWRAYLAGLAAEISGFSALSLVVTCRQTYEAACLPDGLNLRRVVHRGFAGDGAAAARAYLDRHGIDRPAAPFLDAEFTNPLFLSTTVRRLKRENRSAFPPGFDGAVEVFDFWLAGVESSLLDKGYVRIRAGDGRIRRAVMAFADQLALERVSTLPLDQAAALFEHVVSGVGAAHADDDLLWRLIDEGVLRREIEDDREVVGFTFQRFSDHFIAEAYLRLFDSAASLQTALGPSGDLSVLSTGPDAWQYSGVLEALAVQVPERFGVELLDLTAAAGAWVENAEELFAASLRWRSPNAVFDRTLDRFEVWWNEDAVDHDDALELLFQLSSIPDHPLNANHLHERLFALPMPERDRILAEFFVQRDEQSAIDILLDWLTEARLDLAELERVRLAATAAVWFLSSSNRPLRDQTSRALVRVFLHCPGLLAPLIRAFSDVDDGYIRERLIAAAAAAVVYIEGPPSVLREAALEAWRMVFARSPVERHAYVRRFTRALIEAVAHRVGVPEVIDLERCRPPYASRPVEHWPSVSELLPLFDEATEIARSVLGHHSEGEDRFSMPGDFGNYAMGSLGSSFSEAPLTDPTPQTKGQRRAAFWTDLSTRGEEIASAALAARDAHDAVEAARHRSATRFFARFDREDTDDDPSEDATETALEARLEAAETVLRNAVLPDVLPERLPYLAHDDGDYPRLSNDAARRWVAWRAVDLGWRRALHADVESRTAHWGGRHEHSIERIGKKYQWIAYHELIGALGDHHWHIPWRETLEVLDDPIEIEGLDIDLTLAPTTQTDLPGGVPDMAIPASDHSQPETLEAAFAWANDLSDLPDAPSLVETLAEDGTRWHLIEARLSDRGYMEKLQADGVMRTGQGVLQMILLATEERSAIHDRWQAAGLNLGDILQDGSRHDRPFGELRASNLLTGPLANFRLQDVMYGRLSRPFDPHRGEYDFGGGEARSFDIGKDAVIVALNLRPAGPAQPWMADAQGRPALVDTAAFGRNERAVMVRVETLRAAVEPLGLSPAWIFWGEKDGGQGSGHGFSRRGGRTVRATVSGLWWHDGQGWQGSNWAATGLRPRVTSLDEEPDDDEDDVSEVP